MYNPDEGVVRGCHAHKSLQQILVYIHGNCRNRLDNGEKMVPLEKLYKGVYVFNAMRWGNAK